MAGPLVECIPNYSEARRPEVIEEIVKAISSVPDILILDRHSDLDHNRTVITFVGPPDEVEEAAFRSIQKAAQLINLDEHTGEHPRIGATDVVPFVPISDIEMKDCIEIAKRLGQRVGNDLKIPVYLYEEAAVSPERQNLENIRHGQYELLKSEIQTNPSRLPDFGPSQLGTAGATVIGARNALIAFNVYLTTNDVSIAQKISKAVRNSSGGLRFVKAMGVLVDGRAQVSMNLTNYHKTPVARVLEMIKSEAARYGVAIHHSELVGLIPQDALTNAAIWHLQLDNFKSDQILEKRLYQQNKNPDKITKSDFELGFLDKLADATPVPGGGSAAAFSAAAAASLVSMVSKLTIGKKKYEDVELRLKTILERSDQLRAILTNAVQEDANAFSDFMAALQMPKDSTENTAARSQAIENASYNAAAVPLMVAKHALEVFSLANEITAIGNKNAITDAASAGILAKTAVAGAGLNIRINLCGLENQVKAQSMITELIMIEQQCQQLETNLRETLKERGNLPLL